MLSALLFRKSNNELTQWNKNKKLVQFKKLILIEFFFSNGADPDDVVKNALIG